MADVHSCAILPAYVRRPVILGKQKAVNLSSYDMPRYQVKSNRILCNEAFAYQLVYRITL